MNITLLQNLKSYYLSLQGGYPDLDYYSKKKEEEKKEEEKSERNMEGYPKHVFLQNLDNNIYHLRAKKRWFCWLSQNLISYDARINDPLIQKIKPDDLIFYHYHQKEQKRIVKEMKYYKNFKEAYQSLGEKLIPEKKYFADLYEGLEFKEKIEKYGVVVMKLDKI